MGFKIFAGNAARVIKTRLNSHDFAADNDGRIHFAKSHAEQINDSDLRPSSDTLDPESKIPGEHCQQDKTNNNNDREKDDRYPDAGTCAEQWWGKE